MRKGLLVAAVVALAFAYGIGVGRYQWFPFHLIAALRGLAPIAQTPLQQSRLSIFRNTPGAFEFVMLGDSITAAGNWSELFPTVRNRQSRCRREYIRRHPLSHRRDNRAPSENRVLDDWDQ